MIPLAIIGSALIGVILLLFANRKIRKQPYILVVSCKDEAAEQRITEILAFVCVWRRWPAQNR